LALQLLLCAVEQAFVEDAAFGNANLAHGLEDGVLVEFAQTGESDLRDRRPFLHDHDQHAIVGFDRDIPEKSCRKQGAQGLRGPLVGHRVADFDGKVAEDRTRLSTLYTSTRMSFMTNGRWRGRERN
jgi:hypothetical protein